MKKLLFIFSLLFSISTNAQQEIALCEDGNNSFNYITSSAQPGTYTWLVDGNIINDTDSSLLVDWNNYNIGTHIISVTFYSTQGCPSPTISYNVNLIECQTTTMYAPNCFTPDGDENNNVWLPVGYNYTNFHFMIFNRWGELLFESYDSAFGWDGTYKGQPCQDGVYVYVLGWEDSKNKRNSRYGHVTILK